MAAMRSLLALPIALAGCSTVSGGPIAEYPVYETLISTKTVTQIADCMVTGLTNPDRPVIRTGNPEHTTVVVRSHVAATFQFDLYKADEGTRVDIRRRSDFASGLGRAKGCL